MKKIHMCEGKEKQKQGLLFSPSIDSRNWTCFKLFWVAKRVHERDGGANGLLENLVKQLSSSDFFLKEYLNPQTIKKLGNLIQRTKFWYPAVVTNFEIRKIFQKSVFFGEQEFGP